MLGNLICERLSLTGVGQFVKPLDEIVGAVQYTKKQRNYQQHHVITKSGKVLFMIVVTLFKRWRYKNSMTFKGKKSS